VSARTASRPVNRATPADKSGSCLPKHLRLAFLKLFRASPWSRIRFKRLRAVAGAESLSSRPLFALKLSGNNSDRKLFGRDVPNSLGDYLSLHNALRTIRSRRGLVFYCEVRNSFRLRSNALDGGTMICAWGNSVHLYSPLLSGLAAI
jgi:hypothetical protein